MKKKNKSGQKDNKETIKKSIDELFSKKSRKIHKESKSVEQKSDRAKQRKSEADNSKKINKSEKPEEKGIQILDPLASAKSKLQSEQKVQQKENGRRYTEDGLPIYTMEELKMGQGGNTEDCPFDCDCCF